MAEPTSNELDAKTTNQMLEALMIKHMVIPVLPGQTVADAIRDTYEALPRGSGA